MLGVKYSCAQSSATFLTLSLYSFNYHKKVSILIPDKKKWQKTARINIQHLINLGRDRISFLKNITDFIILTDVIGSMSFTNKKKIFVLIAIGGPSK